ncbi:hypothetical protein [Parabacteroides sp. PF5-9]|uniref:hypothetical protein n=1 Tax=Parabacteroides sp. PF5-9 TaxID=1742404 RepID=UPI0024748B8C|nr:hypothetical protein [Parabacteroides sp. PF5-9]MDH6356600.1 hypothetical protein [Parabacteroides sp. PF5-9]
MNKSIICSLLFVAALVACDPIEDRQSMGGAITADQLNISATPVVVDGKNSNKIILENNSPVLSLWDYGLGTTNKAYDEVLLVLTGENKISFTGLNADGSKITKELTVNVDELSFEVPKEWGLFCGDGSKTWTWDADEEKIWGNGSYLNNTSAGWWGRSINDISEETATEGAGAKMIFSTAGSTLTKVLSNGTTIPGTFSFDMSKKTKGDSGDVWAEGKLYTKNVTVLHGISTNEGKIPVYEYDILKLTDTHMVVSYAAAGAGSGSEAWFWMFKVE